MNKLLQIFFIGFMLIFIMPTQNYAQSTLDCSGCHAKESNSWLKSRHANTQKDVANELSTDWVSLPADSVINGQDAEDCIACHGPSSITANGGMTEVQTLNYFFSTLNGLYSNSTDTIHSDEWPNNGCVTCHNVPANHPQSMPKLAIFNSPTATYDSVENATMLCGQCHGTLRYKGTDHRRMDAWKMSKHGHGGQNDVADELSGDDIGSTPDGVISGEDCIGCHASTSVLLNGGITEGDALNLFFTTTNGKFTENTVSQNAALWTEVACTSCHDQHNPDTISYFNSKTKTYEVMPSSQELCGQCHGNLRFPDTDHLSYNIEEGSGGDSVPDLQTMPGVKCVDCHMHTGDVDGTNAVMYGGHSWKIFIKEDDGSMSASCTVCHKDMTASVALDSVNLWKAQFANLDSIANVAVAQADSSLVNSTDSTKIKLLAQAHANLTYAESDESGGVHNHLYTQSLVQYAINKAGQIVTGVHDLSASANGFILHQNYPNPFNLTTTIEYKLSKAANVTIEVFNYNGQKIKTLLSNKYETAGVQSIKFNAVDLPSGIYFCSLRVGQSVRTIKMVLLP